MRKLKPALSAALIATGLIALGATMILAGLSAPSQPTAPAVSIDIDKLMPEVGKLLEKRYPMD